MATFAYLEIFAPGKIIVKENGLPERYYMDMVYNLYFDDDSEQT